MGGKTAEKEIARESHSYTRMKELSSSFFNPLLTPFLFLIPLLIRALGVIRGQSSFVLEHLEAFRAQRAVHQRLAEILEADAEASSEPPAHP